MKTQHKTLEQTLSSYYQMHAPIYDLTRWSFLFGRIGILNKSHGGLGETGSYPIFLFPKHD